MKSLRLAVLVLASAAGPARAQVALSAAEQARYTGLLAAAARGDAAAIRALTTARQSPDPRDGHGRTPLHVAAYGRHHETRQCARWWPRAPTPRRSSATATRS